MGSHAGSFVKDCVSTLTPFQCNIPRDFSVIKRCHSDLMSVHISRDGVLLSWWKPQQVGGTVSYQGLWLLKQLNLCLQKTFGLKACFHIITPIGFAPTLLGSLLSYQGYFWPTQEVQLSMRSQQKSVALPSQRFQPQPGARADELRCCVLYIYTCLDSLKPEKPQAPTAADNTQRFAHRMK